MAKRKPFRKIKLTQGKYALVDAADFDRLSKFRWTYNSKKFKVLKIENGYARCQVDGRGTLMHRFIMGAKKGQIVDHINHKGIDNRRENLRFCTTFENAHNKRKVNGNSIYKGVRWHHTKWQASIRVHHKVYRLGTFEKQWEAALAYNAAAIKYHGEFACINKRIRGTP